MFTPMRNLGANLMFVFAVGGLWAVGYLVSPYLAPEMSLQDIVVLRKSMMLLALLGFFMAVLTRAYELNWRFIQDVQCQLGIAAMVVGVAFLVVPAEDGGLSAVLYGITSLICVAWVAWSHWQPTLDA